MFTKTNAYEIVAIVFMAVVFGAWPAVATFFILWGQNVFTTLTQKGTP